MSMKDPSVLEMGNDVLDETTQSPFLQTHPKSEGMFQITSEGALAKSKEPTLTAPPDDIVYPEARFESIAPPEAGVIPIPPIILRRQVSGSYSGITGSFRMDLRIDVDRPGALNTASFDFYTLGAVTNYFGSFRLVSPVISYTTTKVIIQGGITGTVSVWANRARIEINRNLIVSPAAPAMLTFFQNNTQGTIYNCKFQNPYFRTVLLETDYETGTALATDYNTASLPSPVPHRVLNTVKAYAEAGINMVMTGHNNAIVSAEGGADLRWTETELHASMVRHFSKFNNVPQWAVWLFAGRKAVSDGLLGIMFDYLPGLRVMRQGCAVFQDSIKNYHPGAADYERHLLYTYVHELGHAFNLLHSWDKGRPDSLSWMNYDWRYDQRNGLGSFWHNFNFRFDNGELLHMRHGFRNNVIMGGSDWASGAGLVQGEDIGLFNQEMIENNTGLQLELGPVKKTFILGEPVVTEIKLRCLNINGQTVNANLHPKYEQVRIGILKPNGNAVVYESLAHNNMMPKDVTLTKDDNTVYASAYIGYGKEGFYFDQPGFYRLKAAYLSKDGSVIQSEEVTIRVKSPVNDAENEIADLYFTNEAGALFYLMGSDSESLKKGMDDMKLVSEKYKTNSLSLYAEMVLGVNEAMKFKTVDSENGKVAVRQRNLPTAKTRLGKVISASKENEGIDNITLNFLFRHLATGYLREGDEKTAKATLDEMEKVFKAKNLNPAVQQIISKQAAKVLTKK